MRPAYRNGSARRRVRHSLRSLVFIVARDLTSLAPNQVGVDHRVEVAFQYSIDVAHGELAAQVLHQPVRGEHVGADLAAKFVFELGVFGLARLLAFLLQFEIVEPHAELFHGAIAILVLRALILALHYDSGRVVHDAHCRIGHIDVLAAGPAGTEGIDAQIFRADIDLDFVVDLRVDEYRRERGVASRIGIERRDAHQAMYAALRLQQAVRILGVDFEGYRFDAGAFALEAIGDDGLEALALGPSQIHAQQHLGPVLALGAARARVYGDDGAAPVVFVREQHGPLEALEQFRIRLQIALDIARNLFALARQLEQSVQIVGEQADALVVGDGLLEPLAVLHDLLALLGLRPEVGCSDLLLGPG